MYKAIMQRISKFRRRHIGMSATITLAALTVAPSESSAGKLEQTGTDTADIHPISVDVDVWISFPLTQADLDQLQEHFTKASRLFCDVTDGRVLIENYNLSDAPSAMKSADVRFYPAGVFNNHAVCTASAPFGMAGQYVRAATDIGGAGLAHELSHCILGLKDSYDEQYYHGTACGIGLAVNSIDDTHNTIMTASHMKCYDSGNNTWTTKSCILDEQCCVLGQQCTLQCLPPTNESEYSSPGSFEDVSGWQDSNSAHPEYPGPRGGRMLNLALTFGELLDTSAFTSSPNQVMFIDDLGYLRGYQDAPSRHMIELSAQRSVTPGVFLLKAQMQGQELLWNVCGNGGTCMATNTLELRFDPLAGGVCGQMAPLIEVNSEPLATVSVTLTIPASIMAVPEFGEMPLPARDLDVVFRKVCQDLTTPATNDFDVAEAIFPVTGLAKGDLDSTFIGANAESYPNDEPVFQQLGLCDDTDPWDRIDDRWSDTNQRWENSNEWILANSLVKKAVCTGAIGDHGCACFANQQCNGGNVCRFGKCFDPSCTNESGCGLDVFETGSDWEMAKYTLEHRWPETDGWLDKVHGDTVPPKFGDVPYLPNPAAPIVDCDSFTPQINGIPDLHLADVVAVLVDTSGSMGETWSTLGMSATQLDWASSAVNHYAADLQLANHYLALISFAATADVLESGVLVDGAFDTGEVEKQLSDLEPGGRTAIGDAIIEAIENFDDDPYVTGHKKGIFIVTDGAENTYTKMPLEAACEEALTRGIHVSAAPIGEFDEEGFKCVSDTDGKLVSPLKTHEIPGAMLEMQTHFEGQEPSKLYEDSLLTYADPSKHYSVLVEPNAEALEVLVSPWDSSREDWDVELSLTGPQGEFIEHLNPYYMVLDTGNFTYSARIPNPSAGTWDVHIHTPGDVALAQSLTARVVHEGGPECDANLSMLYVKDINDEVEISVGAAVQGVGVGKGAVVSATILKPDGTSEEISLEMNDAGVAIGKFSNYSSNGMHRIHVECQVPAGSELVYGELNDGTENPVTEQVPYGFERATTLSFMVNSNALTNACAPADWPHDCDGDSITDYAETQWYDDVDQDGLMNYVDHDSDNDDVPDMIEGTIDSDGEGVPDRVDIDSDNDGDPDGEDWDRLDPLSYRRFATGDINGDGREDRVWGEPDYSTERGRIMVDYAGDGLDGQMWWRSTPNINGIAYTYDRFGDAVVVADFNGDGYADVAIGAPGDDQSGSGASNSGAVHIIYGSANGLTSAADQMWTQHTLGVLGDAEDDDRFGTVLSAGDFNCDGFADIVIGAPDENIGAVVDAGAVSVLYGSAGGVTSVNDAWYQGSGGVNGSSETNDRFGDTLATGDFDDDSCSDLVIGAPTESWNGYAEAGNGYLAYGTPSGLSTVGDWTIIQGTLQGVVEAYDHFGTRFWVRDGNGDGYDDLVVMTPGDCGLEYQGFNYVWGGSGGLSVQDNSLFCRVTP